MTESELRSILAACQEHEAREAAQPATAALRAENVMRHVRAASDETIDWLADKARLLNFDLRGVVTTPIWIVPNPLGGAYVGRSKGVHDIVVHDGLLQMLTFLIWFWICAFRTKVALDAAKLRPDERANVQKDLDAALTLAIPLVMLSVRTPTRFPDLRRGLTPFETNLAAEYLIAAEMFLLLHEQAHVDLGHLSRRSDAVSVVSEFEVEETLTPDKSDELAADERAIASVPADVQGFVASGAIWLLAAVLHHEAFLARLSNAHPLAVNRMKAIVTRHGSQMREVDRDIAERLIEHGRDTIASGARFASVPDSEKLALMFRGQNATFAADYLEWFFAFIPGFLAPRQA